MIRLASAPASPAPICIPGRRALARSAGRGGPGPSAVQVPL